MAFDEDLAGRIREIVGAEPGVTEKRMFGGLAFLVDGTMAVAASSAGGMMVRLDPETADQLVAAGEADRMVMRDRPMRAWLHVAPDRLRTAEELTRWVGRGIDHARTLPST